MTRIADHHKPILAYTPPIKGYYMITDKIRKPTREKDIILKFRNKGYRNFPYFLLCMITNTDQTLIDTGGASRTTQATYGGKGMSYVSEHLSNSPFPFALNIGSSTSPHDITRFELYSRHFTRGKGGIGWIEENPDNTILQTYHQYAFHPPNRAVGEAGLYLIYQSREYSILFLIARAIISPTVEKPASTEHIEGWRISFPANITRWFLRLVMHSMTVGASDFGVYMLDRYGSAFSMREHRPLAGTPQVWIGSDNSPPSPTDYFLKSPISRLSTEAFGAEIDTSLQECRIACTGTYTPTTTVTLGEVAALTNVYDITGGTRLIMIARAIWDPPVTLVSGTTYTIGIVIRLG